MNFVDAGKGSYLSDNFFNYYAFNPIIYELICKFAGRNTDDYKEN